ncbi:RES domain protein [Geobacter metallireducens RCH3]|uniref:RES domain protein n=1 Tax=Geobacter metallireducens (strain ATCC 53774 / DSM 7210 / GS-15) TaxID=269799 RepID=Q39V32_GEOMG|nr:RES family NAD+ phosphorylase [Geobacter metallireducens]ABB31892.1 RES domain protein [Geobacter metallireducens GS-15]EHP89223.1 RES domain protein [Geobacter metallireducens RCH3]
MKALFVRTNDFQGDVFRNIVSLRESLDLFDDLTDEAGQSQYATVAEARVKELIPIGLIDRGFHYTTAIDYPFTKEPFLLSRYGNGTFGVWYGSLQLETSIHETVFHMMREESMVEGVTGRLVRERAVYLVRARAVLIDLVGKEKRYPDLVSDDYSFTQQIAERLHKEGHPGLLAPSARCAGTNVVAFTPNILNDPRVNCYLTYTYDYQAKSVEVERQPGDVIYSHQFT